MEKTVKDPENRLLTRQRVFMMDLWAIVPYYTAYLSRALLRAGVDLQVGSITYYLDRNCFSSRGIETDPGLVNLVSRLNLPVLMRRGLKLAESLINLCALTVRFTFKAPDVIHVQYLPMLKWHVPVDLWFLAFCRRHGSKIVLTVHDLLPHDTAETHKETFCHLYATVDGIICHSDHVRTRLVEDFGVTPEKIAVIPHGPFFYDLSIRDEMRYLPVNEIAPDELLVLWQGIIFPYKGVDLLLEAWQKVEASGAKARLVIAGTGRNEIIDAIHEQVVRLELKRVTLRLCFISVEELVELYRAADIVVYPYRAITTSGALATGLSLGKTIIASDLPVFRELLTNGENALLVNSQDSNELSRALMELISNKALRERFAVRVRKMNFGDHSWHMIGKKTLEVYEKISKR